MPSKTGLKITRRDFTEGSLLDLAPMIAGFQKVMYDWARTPGLAGLGKKRREPAR